MNVQGDSFNKGANVHMWNNPWSPASQWYIVPQGDFFVVESARAIGSYLNLKSAKTNRRTNIQLWSNPGKIETRWVLQKVEQCSDEITINGQSGFCSHWCSTPGKWGCGVASVGSY